MVRDMTKGSPVKLLLAFAAPMLLGNLFQQLYSTVDAMVLGRGVGVQALAAAGATGSIHFFVFGFVTGLTHGYSALWGRRLQRGPPGRGLLGISGCSLFSGHHGSQPRLLSALAAGNGYPGGHL